MIKKTLVVTGLGTALVLGLGNVTVFADEAPTKTSDTNLTLQPSSNPDGPLQIDQVSALEFGTHDISNKNEEYVTETENPSASVSDMRGNGAGWTLEVNLAEFTDANQQTLKGAELTLAGGQAQPDGKNVSTAPTTVDETIQPNGAASVIMEAAADTGLGEWSDQYAQDNVKLDVPAGNKSGEYHSTLTWTLLDAPAE